LSKYVPQDAADSWPGLIVRLELLLPLDYESLYPAMDTDANSFPKVPADITTNVPPADRVTQENSVNFVTKTGIL
jgi:hypothetical protein